MRLLDEIDSLVDVYDGFLFDAYGVLFDGTGLIKGAARAWDRLKAIGKPVMILTNGSSRTLQEAEASYRSLGLDVKQDEILNSASLLKPYFQQHSLIGAKTAVLGTEGSKSYATDAGASLVCPTKELDFQVLVLANQTDYPLLETLDAVLSSVVRSYRQARHLHLLLTNPDLIYPSGPNNFGHTAGALALMLEASWSVPLAAKSPSFVVLGKPSRTLFDHAADRLGTRKLLMIGDQLRTDILGANAAGMDSLLVGTGLTSCRSAEAKDYSPVPTYLLPQWKEALC